MPPRLPEHYVYKDSFLRSMVSLLRLGLINSRNVHSSHVDLHLPVQVPQLHQ